MNKVKRSLYSLVKEKIKFYRIMAITFRSEASTDTTLRKSTVELQAKAEVLDSVADSLEHMLMESEAQHIQMIENENVMKTTRNAVIGSFMLVCAFVAFASWMNWLP